MEEVMVFGEPVPASDVKEFVRTLVGLSRRRSKNALNSALTYLVDWGVDERENLQELLDELSPSIEAFFGMDAVEALQSFFYKLESHFNEWLYAQDLNRPGMHRYTGPDYYSGSSRRSYLRRKAMTGDMAALQSDLEHIALDTALKVVDSLFTHIKDFNRPTVPQHVRDQALGLVQRVFGTAFTRALPLELDSYLGK